MRIFLFLVAMALAGCAAKTQKTQPPPLPDLSNYRAKGYNHYSDLLQAQDGSFYLVGSTTVTHPLKESFQAGDERTVQWVLRCVEDVEVAQDGGELNCKEVKIKGLPTKKIEDAATESFKADWENLRREWAEREKANRRLGDLDGDEEEEDDYDKEDYDEEDRIE